VAQGVLTPNRVAAGAVLVLGGYLQLVEWVDLHPWNDVRHGNGQETLDLILAGASIILVGWLWISRRWAPLAASLALAAWAWLQIASWWIPYVQGASPGWRRVYARWFADTVQILPRDADHLPPDANHLVLQALILAALIASAAAFVRSFRKT
jgi:hypothetical protein